MKRISFKAVAAAALLIGGLCVVNPVVAQEADTVQVEEIQADEPDQAEEEEQGMTDNDLQAKRMQYDHEEYMAELNSGIDHDPVVMPIIIFICIGVPVIAVFVFLGYTLKKKQDKAKLESETLLKLAESGQQITPEIIEALKTEQKEEKKTSTMKGWTSLIQGLGWLVVVFVVAAFGYTQVAPWLVIPAVMLIGQGAGILLGQLGKKKNNE